MDAGGSTKRSRPVRRATKVVVQQYATFLCYSTEFPGRINLYAHGFLYFLFHNPFRSWSSNRKCHHRSQGNWSQKSNFCCYTGSFSCFHQAFQLTLGEHVRLFQGRTGTTGSNWWGVNKDTKGNYYSILVSWCQKLNYLAIHFYDWILPPFFPDSTKGCKNIAKSKRYVHQATSILLSISFYYLGKYTIQSIGKDASKLIGYSVQKHNLKRVCIQSQRSAQNRVHPRQHLLPLLLACHRHNQECISKIIQWVLQEGKSLQFRLPLLLVCPLFLTEFY